MLPSAENSGSVVSVFSREVASLMSEFEREQTNDGERKGLERSHTTHRRRMLSLRRSTHVDSKRIGSLSNQMRLGRS